MLATPRAADVHFAVGSPSTEPVAALVASRRADPGFALELSPMPGVNSELLAAELLKSSPADGRTVLITVLDTRVIAPQMYANLRFDPVRDFAPITSIVNVTYGFAVKGDGPYKTLPQFIEAAHADRNNATVGISGLGVFVQQHKSGRLRVLAVSGEQRASQLPEVPTFKEAGMPKLTFGSAYGLYAPAGTPAAGIDEWNRAVKKVLAREDVRTRLIEIGYQPLPGSTPAELTAKERAMTAHWAPVIKATGFKGDN